MTLSPHDTSAARRVSVDAALGDLRRVSAPYANGRFVTSPSVEPASLLGRLESACRDVFAGLDAVLAGVCDGDIAGMAALCRANAQEVSLLGHQPYQGWATVARPDVITSGDRTLVVEVNSDSPAGLFGLHDVLARAQGTLIAGPDPQVCAPTPTLPALLRGLSGEVRNDGLFAICYWAHERDEGPLSWQYDLFVAELARLGVEAVYCALEDLQFGAGSVRHEGRQVGLVYRCFESPHPANEPEQRLLRMLFRYAADRAVGLFTGYRGETLASKACLSVLTDEQITQHLDPALAARLQQSVPWTRVLEGRDTYHRDRLVDLVPYVVDRRDELILKPVRGHGGRGVVVGAEVDLDEWRGLVKRAVDGGDAGEWWVVQELHVPDPVTLTYTTPELAEITSTTVSIDGCFIVEGTAVGVLRRYAINGNTTLNINPRSGYAPSPVWWQPND